MSNANNAPAGFGYNPKLDKNKPKKNFISSSEFPLFFAGLIVLLLLIQSILG